MNVLYEHRKKEELNRDKTQNIKDAYDANLKHEFEKATEKKGLKNKLLHKVEFGLETARRDLNVRREKLRRMLLEEEAAWTQEYVTLVQKVKENKFEEMKMRAQEIQNKREAERQKLVHEKRIQQYIGRCEELRSIKSKRSTEETKKGQEYQIKERENLREQEREEDRMWAAVARKEYEAKVAREIEDARKKFQRDKETAELLLLQQKTMDEKNQGEYQKMKDEEAKMNQRINEEVKQEKMKEVENKMRAREKVRSELIHQIQKREAVMNRLAREEEIIENAFSKVAKAELERELRAKCDYRETLRREWQLYRDSLSELRRKRAAQEAELEAFLQEERNKIEEERKKKLLQLKEARQKLKDEVLRGRQEQMEQKLEQAERLRKTEEQEAKLQELVREQNARLQIEHDQQIRLLKQKYTQDLQDQIEYTKALKVREREEIEREWKAGLLQEENYKHLIKDIMSTSQDFQPHPFYRVLEASVSLDESC